MEPWKITRKERLAAVRASGAIRRTVVRMIWAFAVGAVTWALLALKDLEAAFQYEWYFVAGTTIVVVVGGGIEWVWKYFVTSEKDQLALRLEQAAPHLVASDERDLDLYVEEDAHGLLLPVSDPEGWVGAVLLIRLTITNRESEPVTLDTVIEVRQSNPPLPEWEVFPIAELPNPDDITRLKPNLSPRPHHGLIMIDAHRTVAEIMKVLVFTLVDLTWLREDLNNIASGAVHTLRLHDRNTGLLAHRALKITLSEETQEGPE